MCQEIFGFFYVTLYIKCISWIFDFKSNRMERNFDNFTHVIMKPFRSCFRTPFHVLFDDIQCIVCSVVLSLA